jgi:AcrR family transcriptional regulator
MLPKVSKEYFENKKNAILDTVERICKTKPLYKLTMKDIVEETGLSFGAVYDSFADIDAVIAALINRLGASVDFKADTERILQAQTSPEEKLGALFGYFLGFARATIDSYGKINYEMSAVITDKKRREKILEDVHDKQSLVYGVDIAVRFIEETIESGYFKPILAKESIYALIYAFFDGVFKGLTLSKCYGVGAPRGITYEEPSLPEALTSSVLALLGAGNHNIESKEW